MDTEIRLALVGRTGSGRSKIGNMILQKECFPSFVSADSVTAKCSVASAKRENYSIVVVDTPGVFHTTKTPEYVLKELQTVVQHASPGPNAFLYTLRIARFSEEEKQTLEKLIDVFGEIFLKFCIVVIMVESNMMIEKDLKTFICELPIFYTNLIHRCDGRLLVINNESLDYNMLLSIVVAIEQISPYYSKKMLQEANTPSKRIYRFVFQGWLMITQFSTHIEQLLQKTGGRAQNLFFLAVLVMLMLLRKRKMNKMIIVKTLPLLWTLRIPKHSKPWNSKRPRSLHDGRSPF